MRPDNFQWRVPVSQKTPFHPRARLVFSDSDECGIVKMLCVVLYADSVV